MTGPGVARAEFAQGRPQAAGVRRDGVGQPHDSDASHATYDHLAHRPEPQPRVADAETLVDGMDPRGR